MAETVSSLMTELLTWVATRPRTCGETMTAWRTSCPRSPIWEDATAAGFVEVLRIDGGMEQWADVAPVFTDDARDTLPRDFEGAGGLHYEPTLIEPLSNDAEIVQKEVFGPVLTLQSFRDEEGAVSLANSTEYGLSGIVYTGSMGRAEESLMGVRVKRRV